MLLACKLFAYTRVARHLDPCLLDYVADLNSKSAAVKGKNEE